MNYNSNLQTNNAEIQALIDIVNALPDASSGIELPSLTNPANNSEVFLGKEYIDKNGTSQVGTFTIEDELTTQNDLIAQIQNAVDNLPEAGSGGEQPSGICPSLTLTCDNVDIEGVVWLSNGKYVLQGYSGSNTMITNIDINTPIFINYYGLVMNNPQINDCSNVEVLVHGEASLVVKCTSTSDATLDLFDALEV